MLKDVWIVVTKIVETRCSKQAKAGDNGMPKHPFRYYRCLLLHVAVAMVFGTTRAFPTFDILVKMFLYPCFTVTVLCVYTEYYFHAYLSQSSSMCNVFPYTVLLYMHTASFAHFYVQCANLKPAPSCSPIMLKHSLVVYL